MPGRQKSGGVTSFAPLQTVLRWSAHLSHFTVSQSFARQECRTPLLRAKLHTLAMVTSVAAASTHGQCM